MRVALVEEMRWLEYGQRLRTETRGVLSANGRSGSAALIDIASAGGARALAVDAGRIAPGMWADFAVLDLSATGVAPLRPGAHDPVAAWVFGGGNDAVRGTCVGGRWQWRTGSVHGPQ